MKITEDKWEEILKYYGGLKLTSMIGSVSSTGQPNVTPIGSLVLKNDSTGYYFDLFTRELSDNLDQNENVCVLFVQTGGLFWFKSLYANECKQPAGIKLIGSAGTRRKATTEEIEALRSRIKYLKILKGYNTIFGNPAYVRDIRFTDYFSLNTGRMTFNF
ncbi:MAG: pyridoxamine 5'-phosphate oxidase family protein [Syntrophomonas sp.]